MPLQFDPNEYRQRLNLALNPSSIGVNVAPPQPAQLQAVGGGRGGAGGPGGVASARSIPMPGDEMGEGPDLGEMPMGGEAGGQGPNLGAGDEESEQAPNLGGLLPGRGPIRTPDFNPNAGRQSDGAPQSGPAGKKFRVVPEGFDPEIPQEKLKDIKTPDDLVNAMPEKRATEFLDWWEKQHGAINDKYDAMAKQFQMPADQKMSRKQKFGVLMQFGLQMMRNSASDRYGGDLASAVGRSAYDTAGKVEFDQRMAKRERQRGLATVEGMRERDLKELGSRGKAMTTQADMNLKGAQTDYLRGREKALKEGKGDGRDKPSEGVVESDQGMFYRQGGKLTRLKDEKGNNLTRTKDDPEVRRAEMDARSGKPDRELYQKAESEARQQLGKRDDFAASGMEGDYDEELDALTEEIFKRYKKFAKPEVDMMGSRGGNLSSGDPLNLRR